jgi:hypothetical protein
LHPGEGSTCRSGRGCFDGVGRGTEGLRTGKGGGGPCVSSSRVARKSLIRGRWVLVGNTITDAYAVSMRDRYSWTKGLDVCPGPSRPHILIRILRRLLPALTFKKNQGQLVTEQMKPLDSPIPLGNVWAVRMRPRLGMGVPARARGTTVRLPVTLRFPVAAITRTAHLGKPENRRYGRQRTVC